MHLAETNGRPAARSHETKTEPVFKTDYDLRDDDDEGGKEECTPLKGRIAIPQAKLLAALDDALELAQAKDSVAVSKENLGAKAPPDVLVPRVTEDMDVSALKAEAWERGWAAPDDVSKDQLLAQLFVGSMCISRFKQMAFKELSELKGLAKETDQKRSATDIYLQHGLEFNSVGEMFGNLASVSKEFRRHCQRSLEGNCKYSSPALFESIARSPPDDPGGRLTYGRFARFKVPNIPGQIAGKPWPWLNVADLRDIDVLIQIEDCQGGPGNGKVLSHAVATLRYNADSRQLYADAESKHFDFEVPIPTQLEDNARNLLHAENPSPQLRALQQACFGQKCKDCVNAPSCSNRIYPLFARIIFRHKKTGRMAVAMAGHNSSRAFGEAADDPVGSYVISFGEMIPPPWNVAIVLRLRLYSEELNEGSTSVKFSTRPFPHSPSDPSSKNYAIPCPFDQLERSEEVSNIAFKIFTIPNGSVEEDKLNVRPLGALRNCFLWG